MSDRQQTRSQWAAQCTQCIWRLGKAEELEWGVYSQKGGPAAKSPQQSWHYPLNHITMWIFSADPTVLSISNLLISNNMYQSKWQYQCICLLWMLSFRGGRDSLAITVDDRNVRRLRVFGGCLLVINQMIGKEIYIRGICVALLH